jgi:predicted nucleotidyltransferase
MPGANPHHPTPYPEINELLARFQREARSLLGAQFAGLYLHGSLAAGDFDPGSSDIDFLVVTAGELPEAALPGLAALHAQLAQESRWGAELEGSYIPRGVVRRYDPQAAVHPHIERYGRLAVEQHDMDWLIQRHVLREHGLALFGPPPLELVDPVSPEALRQATAALLRGWWAQQLADPWRLDEPGYQAYAVLTMCRARYTFMHGAVASKPVAARWAQVHCGPRWVGLIDRAQQHKLGAETLPETLAFLRATLARALLAA